MKNKAISNTLKKVLQLLLTEYKAVILCLVIGIVMSFLSPVFLTYKNLFNVLRQVCVNSIVACSFVIILGAGNIDLSIGSAMGMVGVVAAMMMRSGLPVLLAVVTALVIGLLIGVFNSVFIAYFGLLPFVVTLATQQMFRGVIYLLTGMTAVTGLPEKFLFLGQGYFFDTIPVQIVVLLILAVIMWFVINRSSFGRYCLSIGGNAEATRLCGINVKRTIVKSYMLNGLFVAIAGLVLTSRTASAQIAAGVNMEGDVIAGCVIGGTSLSGGTANVFGAIFGCLLVGLVSNGMNLMGVDANWQIVMKGILILAAVMLDRVTSQIYHRTAA